MSDYWPFESVFESGGTDEWDSVVDTQSKLTVDWYRKTVEQLGGFPQALPYRGSYNMHIDLSLGTADAYVQRAVGFVTALGNTIWIRLYFQVTGNLVMAASDYFTFFRLQSAGAVDQAVLGLINNGGVITVVAAQTSTLAAALGANTRSAPLSLNAWHLLELGVTVDSGASDGTIQFWLDTYKQGSTITALTQAALTQARMGAIGIAATTTAGHLLYDQVVANTAQIGGFRQRYTQIVEVTKSGFVAQGNGKILEIILEPGGATDNHLTAFDADVQPILAGTSKLSPEIANTNPYEPKVFAFHERYDGFNRGLYLKLTGTAPRAMVTFGAYNASDARIRDYARRRPLWNP